MWWSAVVLVVIIGPLTLGERVTSLTSELNLKNLWMKQKGGAHSRKLSRKGRPWVQGEHGFPSHGSVDG